jgi:hypothetical protein
VILHLSLLVSTGDMISIIIEVVKNDLILVSESVI